MFKTKVENAVTHNGKVPYLDIIAIMLKPNNRRKSSTIKRK